MTEGPAPDVDAGGDPRLAGPSHRDLRTKLLRIMLSILIPLTLATLSSTAVIQYRSNQQSAYDSQRMIREGIVDKGRVLTASHALALRGLVADNAISDVRALVKQAVSEDNDVVYGLFLSGNDEPWAYVAPSEVGPDMRNRRQSDWHELGVPRSEHHPARQTQRAVKLFGEDLLEFSAPVREGNEQLGTVRYGLTTARMQRELSAARGRAQATLITTLLSLLGLAVLNLLVGIVLVGRSSTRITEPLNTLREAANTIAHGRRDVRVDVKSGDELELLAAAFNHMLEVNQRTFEQLEETTQRALEAARLKSEFLANMSHEIRTPMNGVMGIAKLMLEMPLEGKLRRYAETIDASSVALLTIINDTLDFSKMEAGKFALQEVEFDPRLVLQDVSELLAMRAAEKGLEIVYRVAPEVPACLVGDPDRLRQVLNNLVGNALKFSERGDVFIEVAVDCREGDEVVLKSTVTDSGIGIAEKDTATIFDAFSQVDGSSVRRHGGTGLGLAISKRLVEMMGGSIGVWSRPNMGSQFWFNVRMRAGARVAEPAPRVGGGARLLLIEHNQRLREVIREHMTTWGVQCHAFASLEAALSRLEADVRTEATFDVIVISRNGNDVELNSLVAALQRRTGRPPPVIALHGPGGGLRSSDPLPFATTELAKPLRFSELFNAVQDAVAGPRRRPGPQAVARPSGPAPQPGVRILVVDDNPTNQFVAAEQLLRAGYEADLASNGAEAVEMASARDYALVLMDCQMPVMDGYAATREIRRREQGTDTHLRIIALTAHALAGERERVLDAGMDDYLSKPLSPGHLERTLARYLPAHRRAAASLAPNVEGSLVPVTVSEALLGAPMNDSAVVATVPEGKPGAAEVLAPNVPRSGGLINLALSELPKQLACVVNALEGGDFPALRAAAHRLKGSALAVGAGPLAERLERLVKAATASQLDECVDLVCAIQSQIDAVESALSLERPAVVSC